jgi:hypothetical protein
MYSLMLIGTGVAGYPNDGTTYLGTLVNTTVDVSSLSGVPFGLTSFDVAGFQPPYTPPALQVVGFRGDGTTVTNSFSSISSSFQTLQLGSGFADLSTVHLTGGFAFDNMVVVIPEPSAGALVLLGTLCGLGYAGAGRGNQCGFKFSLWRGGGRHQQPVHCGSSQQPHPQSSIHFKRSNPDTGVE